MSTEIKQILFKFIQHVNELETKDERTTMTGFEQEFRVYIGALSNHVCHGRIQSIK